MIGFGGLAVAIVGVLVISQVMAGDALCRLGWQL